MKTLRRVSAAAGLALFTLFALFMVSPSSVYAGSSWTLFPTQDDGAPVVAEDVGSQFVITSPVWTILTGVALPIVVGFVTKLNASDRVKAVAGVVVAAVGAIVLRATTVDGAGVLDKALVVDVALVYLPQLASYVGVWSKFDLNQRTAPNTGIG